MKKINILMISSLILLSVVNMMAQGLVIEQGNEVTNGGFAIFGKPLGLHLALSNANIQSKASEGSYTDLGLNYFGGDVDIARSEAGGDANVFIGTSATNQGTLNAYNILFVDGRADRVGIGIDTPNAKLSVQNGDIAVNNIIPGLRLLAVDATTPLAQFSSFGGTLFIENQFAGETADILLQTESGTIKLEDDGKLGIQKMNPSTDVHLKQSSILSAGQGGLMFEENDNTEGWKIMHTGANFSFIDRVDGDNTRRAYIQNDTGNYVQPSDKNLKKDIKKLDNILPKVNRLEPVSYRYQSKNKNSNKTLGFIAQEVEKILPELVHYGENGEFGLAYSEFAVLAIRAIQEQQLVLEKQEQHHLHQQQTVKTLQTTLNNQNQRIHDLEQQLAKISQFIENQPSNSTISGKIHEYEMTLQQEAYLGQNHPNPFQEQTLIDFFIPTSIKNASLKISSTTGKLIQQLPIGERGNGQVVVKTEGLAEGIYWYALILDEALLETKKMVLHRQ